MEKNRVEDALIVSWDVFDSALMGHFIPCELREIKEFLTLHSKSMSVHEYNVIFAQISLYSLKIFADIRSKIILFVFGLSCLSSKEGNATMLIGDMDIPRLMMHVKQLEEDNLTNIEEFKNKRANISWNEFMHKNNCVKRSYFQDKQNGPSILKCPRFEIG